MEVRMKYVALLRGINVGGNNKVPMADLKKSFEKAGFRNISTYINSGNVLFESDEEDPSLLVWKCRSFLEQDFGFSINLSIISAVSLRESLENAPDWWDRDPDSKHNAIFVIPPASAEDIIGEVGAAKPEYEMVAGYQQVIFWTAPLATFSRTRWSKIVGTRAYQDITIRNSNTARKLLELVKE
jgi:uncharacterized protein (DUF1697 family)